MTWATILLLAISGLIQNRRIKRLEKELLEHMERANGINRAMLDSIRILREAAFNKPVEQTKESTS